MQTHSIGLMPLLFNPQMMSGSLGNVETQGSRNGQNNHVLTPMDMFSMVNAMSGDLSQTNPVEGTEGQDAQQLLMNQLLPLMGMLLTLLLQMLSQGLGQESADAQGDQSQGSPSGDPRSFESPAGSSGGGAPVVNTTFSNPAPPVNNTPISTGGGAPLSSQVATNPQNIPVTDSMRLLAQKALEPGVGNIGTQGLCLRGVNNATKALGLGPAGTRGSAWQAADEMANNPNFKEIPVRQEDIRNLPPGVIVVWGQNQDSQWGQYGHIAISLGNGQRASDHGPENWVINSAQWVRAFVPAR